MRVLFDNNLPDQLRQYLSGHEVVLSRELGWDRVSNGDLIQLAEADGFDVMVTGDKRISYQQNNEKRRLALVVLSGISRPQVLKVTDAIVDAVGASVTGSFEKVEVPRPPRRPTRRSDV